MWFSPTSFLTVPDILKKVNVSDESLMLDVTSIYPLIMNQDLLQHINRDRPPRTTLNYIPFWAACFFAQIIHSCCIWSQTGSSYFFLQTWVCHSAEFHALSFNYLTSTLLAMVAALTLRPVSIRECHALLLAGDTEKAASSTVTRYNWNMEWNSFYLQ